MNLADPIIYVVFVLFGLDTLSHFGGWLFSNWRTFQDLKDERNEEAPEEKKAA